MIASRTANRLAASGGIVFLTEQPKPQDPSTSLVSRSDRNNSPVSLNEFCLNYLHKRAQTQAAEP
ncbi:MAG: hypothetical protein JWN98_799 [Abditibacteriota bacterium]|nr:hypothetical protein [Abditibacteriota bacterium]